MRGVFLSYARADEAWARRLAERLAAHGCEVWWDEQIPAHRAYAEVIQQRLAEAGCVIVLWSRESVKSQWVRAEADVARNAGKLIQVTIDEAVPPLPFDQLQRTDLRNWRGSERHAGWRKVLAAVDALAGGGAAVRPAERAATPPPQRWFRSAWVLAPLALALAVLVAFAAWGWWPRPERSALTVAVSAFDAADPALKAMASGTSDAIVADLTQMLTPPVSGPAAQAAGRGGARLVVNGAVSRDGPNLTVRVRFDDVRTGQTLWSAEMRRDAREADALQEQVAARVAQTLNRARRDFGPGGNAVDATALGDYVRILDTITLGIDHFGDTLQADRDLVAHAPSFSHAHASLAIDLILAQRGQSGPVADGWRREARAEIDQALRLNPRDVDAIIAEQHLLPRTAYAQREAILTKGLVVAGPDAWLLNWSGYVLRDVGRTRAAGEAQGQALGLDPLYPATLADNIRRLYTEGRAADSEALAAKALRMWPGNPNIRRTALAESLFYMEPGQALDGLAQFRGGEGGLDPAAEAIWRAYLHDRKSGAWRAATAASLIAAADAGAISAGYAVPALAQMGRIDEAFALADRAVRRDAAQFATFVLFEPAAAPLRRDRRFIPLLARLGVVDYWRTTGRWADFCAEPGLPYDCKTEAARVAAAPSP